ncbi:MULTISPECIES: hypothetical protein [Vibrio]|uniref:hypothetical protein n=1 Tax=Vibrio TaxID=662 RepID=UPI002074C125|nr:MULTISPECIES: hypothetical protein [Vibrio]USD35359.1 hypothetical protein J8Z27_18950 [Vibrio sp. SCSIO 43186]USD48426.1 hypothetical protein J4N38_19350 [Vibrio sp. SCSIO 43145]USD72484.1 hypothetical protein J4N41_18960 [Vibrio sp. SCSIO 43139]USD98160.1 hypothetical protein CTT30_19155 [Vibrio coralliilyticus]
MSVQCKAAMGDDIKRLLSDFQHDVGMFREGYCYMEHPETSVRIARSYMDKSPEFYFLDGWGTPLSVNNECSSMKNKDAKAQHGGKRSGSGRKKGLPTENVRLVSALAFECKQLSDYYKSCSDNERSKIEVALRDLFHSLSANQTD